MLIKQIDFTSDGRCIRTNDLVKKYSKTVPKKSDEIELEVTRRLRKNINLYLEELEDITGRKMSCYQKESIKGYVDNNEVRRIDIVEHNKKRREFHQNCKNIRHEWEIETEQEWPKYQNNVYVDGRLWRIKGENYDAHHIIELRFGGPNVWYNIFPAISPFEHPYEIHSSDSMCTKIFGDVRNLTRIQNKFEILLLGVDGEEPEDRKEPKVTKISENVIRIH